MGDRSFATGKIISSPIDNRLSDSETLGVDRSTISLLGRGQVYIEVAPWSVWRAKLTKLQQNYALQGISKPWMELTRLVLANERDGEDLQDDVCVRCSGRANESIGER